MRHTAGKGLKLLSRERWYGGGYCGICGHRGDELVPQAVQYWEPDAGWKMGVLCSYCGEDAAARGPRPDDYAVVTRSQDDHDDTEARIGMEAADDLDSAYSSNLKN